MIAMDVTYDKKEKLFTFGDLSHAGPLVTAKHVAAITGVSLQDACKIVLDAKSVAEKKPPMYDLAGDARTKKTRLTVTKVKKGKP